MERIEFGNGWYGKRGALYGKDYFVIFGPSPFGENEGGQRMFLEKCDTPAFEAFAAAMCPAVWDDAVELAADVFGTHNYDNPTAVELQKAAALITEWATKRESKIREEITKPVDVLRQATDRIANLEWDMKNIEDCGGTVPDWMYDQLEEAKNEAAALAPEAVV